ncbi:MAG: hypothetical protein LC795_02200 [Acidobacteria bacterium]|nr:hypothetical protein [Acidobacteriota bacterium]
MATNDKRVLCGGAWKPCAPAALLSLAALRAPARAQAAANEETVDSVLTKAGTLAIVRAGPEDGLRARGRVLDKTLEGHRSHQDSTN